MNGDRGVLWTPDFEQASAHGTECLSFASDAITSKSFLNKTFFVFKILTMAFWNENNNI